MDKLRNVAKGGWHPSGDKQIHRDSWKSDLKGIATGKKNDPYAEAREHQSRPLSSLKDPDSFGPPPKHTGAHGSLVGPSDSASPAPTGLGSRVPAPRPSVASQDARDDDVTPPPPLPYRTNTTGLRTDNLPKPPVRGANAIQRIDSPGPTASQPLPPRQPPRPLQTQTERPPILPPRQNEFPDEYSPAPPPPYTEAAPKNEANPSYLNQGAISRLGQAGVSIPAFGIGSDDANANSSQPPVRAPQLSELQARFARMNTGTQPQTTPLLANTTPTTQKKAPPPPPKKKANLAGASQQPGPSSPNEAADSYPTPPPLPLGSKPRPT